MSGTTQIKKEFKAYKRKHEHYSHVKNHKKLKKMLESQAQVLQNIVKKEGTGCGSSESDDN